MDQRQQRGDVGLAGGGPGAQASVQALGKVLARSADGGGSGTTSLSKFSAQFTVPSGAVPPGQWRLSVAATLTAPGGGTETIPAGALVDSDGASVTSAGGTGVLLGNRPLPVWPWPPTFPH